MRAGNLHTRVDLQEKLQIPDGSGGFSETWTTMRSIWASVSPTSGKEALKAGQINSSIGYLVTVRYASDITPKLRILSGSKVLNIRAVLDPAGAHERMELLCEEEAANG